MIWMQFLPEQFSCFHEQLIWLQIIEQQVAIKFFSLATDFFIGHFDLSSGLKSSNSPP